MKTLLFTCAIAAYAFVAMGTLLDVLNTIHSSEHFDNLTAEQQVMVIEMVGETEAGELKRYIDQVGFHNVLELVDSFPQAEAQWFLHYINVELQKEEHTGPSAVLGKRSLVEVLNVAKSNPQFQMLSTADQQAVINVLTAAENSTLTQHVDAVGYSTILHILELLPETERHTMEQYVIEHLRMEQTPTSVG